MIIKSIGSTLLTTVFVVLSIALVSCNNSPSADTSTLRKYQVTGVNEYPFLYNEKSDGGMIAFSSANLKKCTVSFIKNKFVAGYAHSIKQLGAGEFDISCMTQADYFSMSPTVNTESSLTVSKDGSSLSVILSFTLYSTRTKTFLSESGVELRLSEKQARFFR